MYTVYIWFWPTLLFCVLLLLQVCWPPRLGWLQDSSVLSVVRLSSQAGAAPGFPIGLGTHFPISLQKNAALPGSSVLSVVRLSSQAGAAPGFPIGLGTHFPYLITEECCTAWELCAVSCALELPGRCSVRLFSAVEEMVLRKCC
jgi:hypothetical protein